MYKCFVEYRILPERRDAFLAWMSERRGKEGAFEFYEGTDQPGLFVEVWQAASEREAEAVKEERRGERSSWAPMFAFVPGGRDKVHAWVFRPL